MRVDFIILITYFTYSKRAVCKKFCIGNINVYRMLVVKKLIKTDQSIKRSDDMFLKVKIVFNVLIYLYLGPYKQLFPFICILLFIFNEA